MMTERIRAYLSPEALRRSLRDLSHRFPYTLAYLTALCAWLLIMVYHSFELDVMIIQSVTWPLCEGVLLSLAVAIWCEYLDCPTAERSAQSVAFVLVAADCIVLLFRGGVSESAEFIGRVAIVSALLIAILFVPGARGLRREQLWYYSLWQFGALASGIALAVVLAIAILLIFGTLGVLFGLDSWKILYTFEILLAVYLPLLFYLSRVPRFENVAGADDIEDVSPIGAFCKNVLLPLVGVYTLILYVYAAKILFTWELPKDSISMMVAGLLAVSLIMLFGLQRYTFGTSSSEVARKIVSLVRTVLPMALLPLLVLMTIGVVYRVGEYGLTASRLYIVTFNLWAYGIVLYLIFKQNANLNFIAATFAVVFVLVSIIPGLNLTAIATRSVRTEVMRTLSAAGVENFPISSEKLREVIAELPRPEGKNLASRLEYLDDYTDHSRVADIVTSDERLAVWRLVNENDDTEDIDLPYREYTGEVSIPAGYTQVQYFDHYDLADNMDVDSIFQADPTEMESINVQVNDSTVFTVTRIRRYTSGGRLKNEFYGYEFKK